MSRIDSAVFGVITQQIRDRFPVSGVAVKAGVKLQRAGREWKGCCPFHPDKTPSFTIYADDHRFQCFGCGAEGDVLDFVMRAYGVKLREAIDMLDSGALRELEQQRAPEKAKSDTRAVAQRIVDQSQPISGTPAETYLRSRGITIELPHTLRFGRIAPPRLSGVVTANGAKWLPALIAIVTDAAGTIVGLQRTYLTDDGRKAPSSDGKVKFSLGAVAGGSIQLGPPSASILICEGLEDGLTLAQGLGRSVWVAAGTAMLPRIVLPDVVQSVVIAADADAAGDKAARLAGAAIMATGRSVRVMRPNKGFKDFNAELMGTQS